MKNFFLLSYFLSSIYASNSLAHNEYAEGFAVWGNWCGPGHGGGEPIDILDGLCMQHDLCYQATFMFSCRCDRELREDIEQNLNNMSFQEQAIASIIARYFAIAPCIEI